MIDSNNKLNSLSKSLIDSVRNIMEGKKLDPVGKEDEDIDNDGDVDSSDKYLHNRRKNIKASIKKEETGLHVAGAVLKKLRNEEAEQIDELSTTTLQSYRKKARAQGNAIVDKMKVGGGDWSKDQKDTKTLRKRAAGAQASGKQLVKRGESLKTEEADLDEAKKQKQYIEVEHKLGGSKRVPVHASKAFAALNHYRKHPATKSARIVSEEVDLDEALDANARYDQHHAAVKSLLKSIGEHLDTHKKTAKSHENYRGQKTGVHWGHVGDIANLHSQLGNLHDMVARQGEYAESVHESFDEDLTLEDLEQINELSRGTLASYVKKATPSAIQKGIEHGVKKAERDEMDRVMNRHMSFSDKDKVHDTMKTTHADVDKPREKALRRNQGIIRAANRLAKEETVNESPVDGVAPGSMANDGHLCATKVFHKEWAEGTTIYSQHAQPDKDGNIAWYDVMFDHGIEKRVMTEDLEILMAETHERHGKKMKEEVEELDELSKSTLSSYVDKAATDVHNKAYRAGKKEGEGSGYDIKNLTKGIMRQVGISKAAKKLAKEETELDEARGRPRKNPLPTGQSDEPEPRQHIIQQLQRAKLSMQGGAKVKFKNGEEHEVRGHHAVKLLDKYAGMKPHEKEDFQKKIGASHEGLKSEI